MAIYENNIVSIKDILLGSEYGELDQFPRV